MGALSIWHWIVLLIVVLVVFGTGKLRTLGTDLGTAIKDFRKATRDGAQEANASVEAMYGDERKAAPDESKQNVKQDAKQNV